MDETRPEFDEPCPEHVSLIVRAADGSLDADAQARLDAHLATCRRCAAAVEHQRAARAALEAWPRPKAPPEFAARVLAAVEDEASWVPRWDFRQWTWRLTPVAAALALAAYLVVGQTAALLADTETPVDVPDPPVATALWSDSVTEGDLVSLLLSADADESLADALEEAPE